MTSATFENIIREIEHLTPEERHQLRVKLDTFDMSRASEMSYVDFLQTVGPLDPDVADEMERAIEEDCERIDPNGW
jgi:hypothetical protein